MTAVINIRHDRSVLDEPDVVRIDRATTVGQSFRHRPRRRPRRGDREIPRLAVARVRGRPHIGLAELAALDGKRLACWCAPEPCHGDVLAAAARWAAEQLRSTGD